MKQNTAGYLSDLWRMSAGVVIAGLLSSCAVVDWFAGKTSDDEVKEMDKDVAKSVEKKATAYDESLKKFGRMLDAYNISTIRVQSKLISNQTAEKGLPDDVSRMLISAVNKIGPKIIYVPYDPSYVINEANTGGDINRALPNIVLAGGITEYDKDLIEKNRELKSEVSIQEGDFGSNYSHDGGLGYKAGSGVSRLTLDLQLMNYRTQTYLSGIQAINQVNMRKTELGWGVGYFFQGSGLAFQYSLRKKQGQYYAIRLLVELSVLEVLGKYFDVPYWKCVDGMATDTTMIARLRDEFDMLDDARQVAYLKEYLFFHGDTGIDRQSTALTPDVLSKIDQAVSRYGCSNRTDLFIKLWETVPIKQARQRNKEYERQAASAERQRQNARQQNVARYNELIGQADSLYNSGKLQEAAAAYRQAGQIFPEQNDPKAMLARISQELAAKASAPAAPPAATPAPGVPEVPTAPAVAEVPAAPAAPAPAPEKKTVKSNKEKPLNPFKSVEW